MDTDINFVSASRRSAAVSIDITIVLILRIFVAQIMGILWLNDVIANFLADFKNHFGTEYVSSNPEHLNFISNHKIFPAILIFYAIIVMVGAIYHAYLNSSAWQGTVGKRLMKIMMINEINGKNISFLKGLAHYFLSLLPFAFLTYLFAYQGLHNLNFIAAITANAFNISLSFLTAVWVQTHIFTKKKTTIYDLICKVIFIEGKTSAKYPTKNV